MLFFAIYSFFNIYHLIRFGFASLINVLIITTYIAITTILIIYSLSLLSQIDWTIPIINLDMNSFNTSLNI
ncbi:MAG: hypothetical protein COT80_00115 [Candidatus Buchananbacteria bacterium CG10_big_fil_rev_8_21_14_0_10_33_19]|uniref:Uncharacterized protein n=1 Tax=Candidatus Buchananbacteria bacterium CG10_big_fil_rev_8_21_14_0_10_33_19 TaxID=1974525 RepID=A0A2H0W591_9BACT|nr:MAG: hypothetical protein COT80_00115 [Candidatus Buchananbacteria bacterium CG10_big_fil_rev_8_21_14_0_10_33_19]